MITPNGNTINVSTSTHDDQRCLVVDTVGGTIDQPTCTVHLVIWAHADGRTIYTNNESTRIY